MLQQLHVWYIFSGWGVTNTIQVYEMPYVTGMKQENIGNEICIDVFMKHEFDMKHENELKHEHEHERQYVINT